jgi:hypothetical protein
MQARLEVVIEEYAAMIGPEKGGDDLSAVKLWDYER